MCVCVCTTMLPIVNGVCAIKRTSPFRINSVHAILNTTLLIHKCNPRQHVTVITRNPYVLYFAYGTAHATRSRLLTDCLVGQIQLGGHLNDQAGHIAFAV